MRLRFSCREARLVIVPENFVEEVDRLVRDVPLVVAGDEP
jgi:hypothetical protein